MKVEATEPRPDITIKLTADEACYLKYIVGNVEHVTELGKFASKLGTALATAGVDAPVGYQCLRAMRFEVMR